MTAQRFDNWRKLVQRLLPPDAVMRRWGTIVPGRAAAARQDTEVKPLPGRDAVRARRGQRVVLYQVNHENAAGSDRDLVRLIVQSLVCADGARRQTMGEPG